MKFRTMSAGVWITLLMMAWLTHATATTAGNKGESNLVRQERNLSGFTAIDVSGAFEVFLKQGDKEAVAIEADEKIQKLIRTELRGTTLHIFCDKPLPPNPGPMKAYITFKMIDGIDISGAVELTSEEMLKLGKFRVDASGASGIRLDVTANTLDIDCSGASKLNISGSAGEVRAEFSGASNFSGYDLISETFHLTLSGAGSADLHVTRKLVADVSGAGKVRYKGNPTEIEQEVSGAGSVKKVQ